MPTVAYQVEVCVSGVVDSRGTAVAEASRYLAYGDQTDTFGYNGRVFDVDVGYDRVRLHFSAPIGLQPDKEKFENELENLAKVESWEEVSSSSSMDLPTN